MSRGTNKTEQLFDQLTEYYNNARQNGGDIDQAFDAAVDRLCTEQGTDVYCVRNARNEPGIGMAWRRFHYAWRKDMLT